MASIEGIWANITETYAKLETYVLEMQGRGYLCRFGEKSRECRPILIFSLFFFLQGQNGNHSQTLSTKILQITLVVKSVIFIYPSTITFEEGKPHKISCKH